ncbi:MAG: T9SS type A sorting domain-containing protein [Ignavibacteriales bacterium]|nr:T9SS type A sorting domain-containing protein [Ignavibacteriales bacterium]MCB9211011.1 T9SS type A sorting domain-containing protein [Ignavibacteriales bacterium]
MGQLKLKIEIKSFIYLLIISAFFFSTQLIAQINELSIMPLGNSITFDSRVSENRSDGNKIGYRYPLYNLLNNLGINFDFIGSEHSGGNYIPTGYDDNAGFPGIKDSELANLLKTGWRVQLPAYNQQITNGPYLETYTPDIILLHIGTNGNNESGGTSAADVKELLDEVDRVENLLNKKIPVIVARIIDRVPNQNYVNEFNDNVDSLVNDRINNPANPAYPDNLYMVDMQDSANIIYSIDYMGTVGNGIIGDMSDYLHPNDKGLAKMAQVWFNKLKTIYPNPIVVLEQPKNVYAIEGDEKMLSINVSSSKPVSYQWKKDGVDIPGANDSVYVTSPLTLNDDSTRYVCEMQSNYYTILSDTATIFVSDTTLRISNGLLALYNFDIGEGDTIKNHITQYPDLDLIINDTSSVNWIPFGLNIKNDPKIYTSNSAKDIYINVTKSNEITLEAWVKPLNNSQNGPARIITISEGTSNRNVTLGQSTDKYEVRLRSTETSNNGIPSVFSTSNSATTNLTHLVFSRHADSVANIYINGVLNSSLNISGNLSNWDSTYYLGIAGEILGDRLWLGELYLIGIYDRALSSDEVIQNYNLKFTGYNNLLEKPTNLTASILDSTNVILDWEDNTTNELGYIIERKSIKSDSLFTVVDSVSFNVTTFVDTTQKYDSVYVYRIKAYKLNYFSDYSNEATIFNIPVSVFETNLLHTNFNLSQNYPNPFNPTTTIEFSIARESEVELKIYNSIGEVVKTIIDKKIKTNGVYSVTFNGFGLASGIYFYRLIANPLDGSSKFIKMSKAILLK